MFLTAEERKLKKEAKRAKKEEEEAKQREWEKNFTEKKRSKDKGKAEFFLQQKEEEDSKKNSREMNQSKYEIWSNKDAKGKMLIDRYQLHDKEKAQQKKEERAKELASLQSAPHIQQKTNRPSEYIKGNTAIILPEPKVYTPSHAAPHMSDPALSSFSAPVMSIRASASAIPDPTAFSHSTGIPSSLPYSPLSLSLLSLSFFFLSCTSIFVLSCANRADSSIKASTIIQVASFPLPILPSYCPSLFFCVLPYSIHFIPPSLPPPFLIRDELTCLPINLVIGMAVTLIHKNNVCYWPVQLVTEENLIERFLMKKPALRLANIPKGYLPFPLHSLLLFPFSKLITISPLSN